MPEYEKETTEQQRLEKEQLEDLGLSLIHISMAAASSRSRGTLRMNCTSW